MLALPWKRFDFYFETGEFKINGKPLVLKQRTNQSEEGTGLVLWDSAIVLCKFIEKNRCLVENKSVVELGCGTGVVSIAASFLNAKSVIATDLNYAVNLANQNVQTNIQHSLSKISCKVLDWFSNDAVIQCSEEKVDILLAADVIWVADLVPALVSTISAFFSLNESTIMYISNQRRSLQVEEEFFNLIREAQLSAAKVSVDELHQDFTAPEITVFRITK